MKKIYNSPVIEILEFKHTSHLLTLSLTEGEDGDGTYSNRGFSDKQKSGEALNDWDNIWGGM